MIDFETLKKNLKKDISISHALNIAVMGDAPTQLLCVALKGMGIEYGLYLNIWESDYNQIDRIVFSQDFEQLRSAEIILIFESTHNLLQKFNKCDPKDRVNFAVDALSRIKQIAEILHSKMNSSIIYCNFVEEDDCVFGQFASKVEESFLYQLRKLNYLLQDYSLTAIGLYICDLSSIQNLIGRERYWDAPMYATTEMALSLDALPYFANSVLKILTTLKGKVKKCIIIDLDNTIWGGVIGDDGVDNIQLGNFGIGKVYTEFQFWLKKMQQRGVVLAVCSKNAEEIAKLPFLNHPDMVLRLSDIAIFVANWDSKSDNIKTIQHKLNIGFDSMVFIDDNPYERELVKTNIPEITVPELPEDPALYLDYLCGLNLFETVSYANEDANRTQYYQSQANFKSTLESYTNVDEFLESVEMYSSLFSLDAFTIPRVAQLSQRSNQFNLRTIRYTEEQLHSIATSEDYYSLSYTLEDKFGDNGLISAVILKKHDNSTLFIESWFMSCRVFKRGMEDFIMNSIIELAYKNNIQTIIGEYIPTTKNVIVKDLFLELGFVIDSPLLWKCQVDDYKMRKNYIQLK